MGWRNKNNDNTGDKVIPLPKEIEKTCGKCQATISARREDMKAAMSLHLAMAHGVEEDD